MCGRYALGIRMGLIRQRLQQQGMQVDDAPDDDDVRESYNFAPGYYGAVYRADTPDRGGPSGDDNQDEESREAPPSQVENSPDNQDEPEKRQKQKQTKYKLQSMKWGLIPFWTKRSPNYGTLMRTINCRDDSLLDDRGMWTSMKRRKRCVIVCQGFYEWLKKGPGGKERLPYFTKRKDGELMLLAGLWDCVKYDDSDEKNYTYTIITTSANRHIQFLHDRMPVILDPNTTALWTWLDPDRTTWSKELQSILKPYEGLLETYPVSKDVGKVGNNSADFIVPIDSKDNKKNIANFFANAGKEKAKATTKLTRSDTSLGKETTKVKQQDEEILKIEQSDHDVSKSDVPHGIKREYPHDEPADEQKPAKTPKTEEVKPTMSPAKTSTKTRSATSNGTTEKINAKRHKSDGSKRITQFFGK